MVIMFLVGFCFPPHSIKIFYIYSKMFAMPECLQVGKSNLQNVT